MKKTLLKMLLISATLFAGNAAYSQVSFNHSIGAAAYIAENGSGWAAMYSPRVNVIELADEMTISVGTHLGLGFSGSANSQSGESSSSLLLDLPLMAEFNIGHAANPDASSAFGGFAGVGFGYNKMSYSDAFSSGSVSSSGLVLNAGIRGLIKERSVGLRVSYMLNTAKDGSDVIGVGFFYTIGMD